MTLYLCFIFPLSKCQEIKSVICQKSGFQNHTHHLLTKNYFSCNRCQVIPRNISTEAHWDSYVNAMFNNLVREHCHLCKCFLKSLIINVYVVAINDEHSWGFCWDKHDLFKQITPQKHRFQCIFCCFWGLFCLFLYYSCLSWPWSIYSSFSGHNGDPEHLLSVIRHRHMDNIVNSLWITKLYYQLWKVR